MVGRSAGASAAPRIRTAAPADGPAVARIYVASWNAGFRGLMPPRRCDDDEIDRWRRDLGEPWPHRWWVAELERGVAGFAGICPSRDPVDPTLGELDTIAVAPDCWRRGVGRTLMAQALAFLARDGYREALLWTLADYPHGHAFYRDTGWQPDGGTRSGGLQVRFRHAIDP